MARYIDADKFLEQLEKKKSEVAKVRYTDGFNDAIMRVKSMVSSSPTADVVPKSEVEILQAEIRGYDVALKCDAEHYRAAIKTLQMENNTLIKNRDKLLQSYAKGIFEEIDVLFERFINDISYSSGDLIYDVANLKKKYTEGEK